MGSHLKVLHLDASSGFYKMEPFELGRFFGPVDLGMHLSYAHNSLNLGTGLFCGSVFPGASNRLVLTGFSPCAEGFYTASMGAAGLSFHNLGLDMLSIRGRAPIPSILHLNRVHGDNLEVGLTPVNVDTIWNTQRKGVYGVIDNAGTLFADRYRGALRVLATGPAARSTDFGAIVSVEMVDGIISSSITRTGRGGFGSRLFQEHGIAGIVYGGAPVGDDFNNGKKINRWFENDFATKKSIKDMITGAQYGIDTSTPKKNTLLSQYGKMEGKVLAFNYATVFMTEEERLTLHRVFITDHYLEQLKNSPSDILHQQGTDDDQCAPNSEGDGTHTAEEEAFEPYQALGPLCGVFDLRAADKLNQHADILGFDKVTIGGVLSWLMECTSRNLLTPSQLCVSQRPIFFKEGFSVESDSMQNAASAVELMDSIVEKKGALNLENGARTLARDLSTYTGKSLQDVFLYTARASKGWTVPNQYWSPDVLSPTPITRDVHMWKEHECFEPRELGRKTILQMQYELLIDNIGLSSHLRDWAAMNLPQIMGALFDKQSQFIQVTSRTEAKLWNENSPVFWESERNIDFVFSSLERFHLIGNNSSPDLMRWIDFFAKDKRKAAIDFWFEMQKGSYEQIENA